MSEIDPALKKKLQDLADFARESGADQTHDIKPAHESKGDNRMQPNASRLTAQLEELARLANESGAQGVWLIRGAQAAQLTYIPVGNLQQPEIPGAEASLNLSLALDIADAGVLVLMRFPSDGKEPGIEVR